MAFYDCVQTLQLCKILLLQQKSNVLDVSYVGKRDRVARIFEYMEISFAIYYTLPNVNSIKDLYKL